MTTLSDIANKTGYSVATISKALNGYDDISVKTKKEIINVAEKLNYYPDYRKKNLKKSDKKSIAFIVNGLNSRSDGSTIVHDLMAGIFDFATTQDIDFIIYTMDKNKQDQLSYYQFCKSRDIDGAILLGIALDDPYFQELEASNLPIMLIDVITHNKSDRIGAVTIKNEQAAFDAVNYLIQMGHENIAFINGKKTAQVSIEREKGYRRAMANNNLEVKDNVVIYSDYDLNWAFNSAMQLLQTQHDVTGIFCASDIIALGVYEACIKLELKIPDDISIVGFDGIPTAKYISPKLTTVQQDMYKMGQIAAEHLREVIYKNKRADIIYVPYNLEIRDSVKKIE